MQKPEPSAPPAAPPAPPASVAGAHPAVPPAPPKPVATRTLTTEPVPEPAPDVTMRMITSEVEENIPYPDAPPPPIEPGSPFGAAPPRESAGAPEALTRTQPAYPIAARAVGAEGQVRLRLSVLPDGRVDRAAVVDCSRPGVGFEAAAIEAVKQWRYVPAPKATSPRIVVVAIQFKKQDARP